MRKSLATVGLLAVGISGASVATASATSTTTGKLARYSYASATKIGKLKVAHGGRTLAFRVTAKSDCGYSTGQMGDQIACKTLGKGKYAGKPVYVTWHRDGAGHRVVDVAAVDLSH